MYNICFANFTEDNFVGQICDWVRYINYTYLIRLLKVTTFFFKPADVHAMAWQRICSYASVGRWFSQVLWFPPPINLPPRYNWSIGENYFKLQYSTNPVLNKIYKCHFRLSWFDKKIPDARSRQQNYFDRSNEASMDWWL